MLASKRFLVILGLIVLMVGSSAPRVGASAFFPAEPGRANPEELDFSKLETGDVILRKGRSFVSELITMGLGSEVSHCGVILQSEGNWKVLHIISGRISNDNCIRLDPLEDFISEGLPGSIYHVKPVKRPSSRLIERESLRLLQSKVSFDHDFDLGSDRELYCSELVRDIYLRSGSEDTFIYKTVGGKALIDLQSFFDKRYYSVYQKLQFACIRRPIKSSECFPMV